MPLFGLMILWGEERGEVALPGDVNYPYEQSHHRVMFRAH
jgi:hypothetical protein